MKNIYKLAVILIALGLALTALGTVLGAGRGVYINKSGVHVLKNSKNAEARKISERHKNIFFDNINITAKSADIKFVKSDNYGVEITYYDDFYELVYDIGETEDGLLNINFKERGVYFFSWNLSQNKSSVLVYLPESAFIDKVTVTTNSGDINLSGFSASDITARTSSGNLDINNVSTVRMSVNTSSGDIYINDVSADNMGVNVSSGNINFDSVSAVHMSVKTSSGDVTAGGLYTSGLSVTASSGNIKLNGGFKGESKIRVSSGDVKIVTSESVDSYSCVLSVSSGRITYDGITAPGKKLSNELSRENTLEISASSGNIDVEFKR